jgi:hypothetical protein
MAANANAGLDVIVLQAGTIYILSIPGSGGTEEGDLDVSDSLIVQGGDKVTTIIDTGVGFNDRIFDLDAGDDLVSMDFAVSDLTIQGGETNENGGAVRIRLFDPQAFFTNVIIQNNQALQAGGGISFIAGGSRRFVLKESEILNNSSGSGGGAGVGGGVFCSGAGISCEIEESRFSGNESINGIGGGGFGGGLVIGSGGDSSLQHTIIKSVFENNTSTNTSTGIGDGGGLYFSSSKGLKITETQFLGNVANNGQGGGAWITSGGQAVGVENCIVQDNASDGHGGGMYVSLGGTVSVTDSTFDNNESRDGGSGQGGGLYVNNGNDITVTRSTFSSNHADGEGGGASFVGPTDTEVTNSTFSGNTTELSGGGMWLSRGGSNSFNNVTVVQNTSTGSGGGVQTSSITVFRNSLFFQNSAASGDTDDCAGPLGGVVTSDGYNIFGPEADNADCPIVSEGINLTDQYGVDPLIGVLADNGGLTFTHALLTGSPAIDGGNPAGCKDGNGALLTEDQRGQSRPSGAECDIGAYELQVSTPTPSPTPTPTPDVCVPEQCNDGNACNGLETCQNNQCTPGSQVVCSDDGNQCNGSAPVCNPSTGQCENSIPPLVCDDNNKCTTDSCHPSTGCKNIPKNVNDNNACTTDSCNPATGNISHVPVNCQDGNACNGIETCNSFTGCHPASSPLNCDDNDPCTADSCDSLTGCGHDPIPSCGECEGVGAVLSFEQTSLWKVIQGSTTLSRNTSQFTHCSSSLKMTGNNFVVIESARMVTSQMPDPTSKLAMDLFIGTRQPNPSWIGQIQLYAHCPSCGIYNQWLSQVELTPLPRGRFVKVTFPIPGNVVTAINQNHNDFSWRLGVNTNAGSGPYYLDHLRFE